MKSRRVAKATILALALLLLGQTAWAQTTDIPRMISYQGIVTQNGTAVTGEYPVTVKFYADPDGKEVVWEGIYTTTLSNGIFNLVLGSGDSPLPEPRKLDKPLWVGVAIAGGEDMKPYSQLTTSAYAINVPDKSITKEKLADDYVGSISINGKKITRKGSVLDLKDGMGTALLFDETTHSLSINSIGVAGGQNPQSANGGAGTVNTANNCGTNSDGTVGTNEVAGGCGNTIYGNANNHPINFSTISGGQSNTITSQFGANPAGEGTNWHTIGGGENNRIMIDINAATENTTMGSSTIGGGQGNTLSSPWGFIGGGQNNFIGNENPVIDDDGGDIMRWDVIAGGDGNNIMTASQFSVISGGQSNNILGAGFSPGAGQFTVTAFANQNTIGGGVGNNVLSVNQATIGGGNGNTISTNANGGTIAGGWENTSIGNVTAIGGGDHNSAFGEGSAIPGGTTNIALGQYSAIAGGSNNIVGRMSFVGGGFQNDATGLLNIPPTLNIDCSTTLGGSLLKTSGQNQAVLGWMNLPFGNNHITTNGPNDDRIFEIGSAKFVGNNWVQNNAFEVSYNGHSIVTHTNGSSLGGSPKVYQGATYVESPVYAWGAIDAAGNPIGNANFGISQVIPLWPMFTPNQGTYLITLAPADPHGGPIPDITQASVTVTVLNNKTDDFILAPPIPPMAPGMEEKFIAPRTISDSLVQAIFGPPTIERVSSDSPEGLQSPTPIDQNATYCGYATASQVGITILATTYPNSFIVRTYGQISLENPCYQQPRAFFFKVTHR